MSSHHIVRDNQEPALVILDTAAALEDYVQQLLEWSPTVMVAEPMIPEVLTWGIKIDVAIVSPASLQVYEELLHGQAPVKLLASEPGEEAAAALHFLKAANYKSVNVLGGSLRSMELLAQTLDVVVFINGTRWAFIRKGHYEKWLPAASHLELHPPGDQPGFITTTDGVVTIHRDHPFWIGEKNS